MKPKQAEKTPVEAGQRSGRQIVPGNSQARLFLICSDLMTYWLDYPAWEGKPCMEAVARRA